MLELQACRTIPSFLLPWSVLKYYGLSVELLEEEEEEEMQRTGKGRKRTWGLGTGLKMVFMILFVSHNLIGWLFFVVFVFFRKMTQNSERTQWETRCHEPEIPTL